MKNFTQWVFFTLFIAFSLALAFKPSFVFCVPLTVSAYFFFNSSKQIYYTSLEEKFQDMNSQFSKFEENTQRISELSDKVNQMQLANGMRKIR